MSFQNRWFWIVLLDPNAFLILRPPFVLLLKGQGGGGGGVSLGVEALAKQDQGGVFRIVV